MFDVAFGIIGGIGLFLFGMRFMAEGLQNIAGDKMKDILHMLTKTPVMGVLVGALVTAIIQSSSATTVMLVGFVNSGLISLQNAVGIVMGANIGTTVTAQLISFNLGKFALPSIGAGFLLYSFSKQRIRRLIGQVILGFGFLFLGLNTMKLGVEPLRESPVFVSWMVNFGIYPILGIIVGALITVIIQSSSATIGILIAVASQGLLPFSATIPVLLGDNIGTTLTAVLSSIGTNVGAKRTAVVHVVFNLCGIFIVIAFLPVFTRFILMISPEGSIERQIANVHTIFNVLNTIIWLPFMNILTNIAIKIVPGREQNPEKGAKYLDKRMLNSPLIALGLVKRELIRMGNIVVEMLERSEQAFVEEDNQAIDEITEKENIIDELEADVVRYLSEVLSNNVLTHSQSKYLMSLMKTAGALERIGDHTENIAEFSVTKVDRKLAFSDQAIDEIKEIMKLVMRALSDSIEALRTWNIEKARSVVTTEERVDELRERLRIRHIVRLESSICYPGSAIIFVELIANLERISDHATNIAEIVLGEDELL